ncbi:MAG: hypothetical protein H0V82_10925 [Candidatus Protochlamydia sp.]|nr:hypothetical protein [Candidatus Protochlamydia sp.]
MTIRLFKFLGTLTAALALFYSSYSYSQVNYPYTSGQAVFVQSPYNSSLYTNYDYNSRQGTTNRLPAYTTNQAVFVQRPYLSTQTVTSYPSSSFTGLPRTDSRYYSPAAFPSTVAPSNPYGANYSDIGGQYTTTNQTPTYNYPYPTSSMTSTSNYPYTQTTPISIYPSTSVQQQGMSGPAYQTTGLNTYQGATYSTYPGTMNQATTTMQNMNMPGAIYNDGYPVTTISQYPYPTTTTAVPETIIRPAPQPQPKR